jgi:hypothetical protein
MNECWRGVSHFIIVGRNLVYTAGPSGHGARVVGDISRVVSMLGGRYEREGVAGGESGAAQRAGRAGNVRGTGSREGKGTRQR